MRIDILVRSRALRFGLSLGGVVLAAFGLLAVRESVNATTVAMILLVIILSSATFFGRNPALVASFAAMLIFNYFFLPPYGTWHIADPQNLIAWAAFTITAIVAGELSAYARRRAVEAEQLYGELQDAFEAAADAEALKRSEKLKTAVLDAVTHDLRTPLTSIKAAVTTLLESEGGHRTIELDSSGRSDFLDVINEETDRLNGFIESMVQLARLEAGTSGADRALANVEEIISVALDRAERAITGHDVVVNLQKDLPPIRVDSRAIAEVLYNLVENAAKYSPVGTVITITASAGRGNVSVSVADQGKGVAPEHREKIFEKFFRVQGERSDGIGLGLAISKGIVESQGGSIRVKDGTAGGSVFIVEFPKGEVDERAE